MPTFGWHISKIVRWSRPTHRFARRAWFQYDERKRIRMKKTSNSHINNKHQQQRRRQSRATDIYKYRAFAWMDVCNVLPVVAQKLVKTVHSVACVRYGSHTKMPILSRFFFVRSKYSFVFPVKISVVIVFFSIKIVSFVLLEHKVSWIKVCWIGCFQLWWISCRLFIDILQLIFQLLSKLLACGKLISQRLIL